MNSYREYKRRRGRRDFAHLFQHNRLTLLAGGKLYQKPKKPKEQQKKISDFAGEGVCQLDTISVEDQAHGHRKEQYLKLS